MYVCMVYADWLRCVSGASSIRSRTRTAPRSGAMGVRVDLLLVL